MIRWTGGWAPTRKLSTRTLKLARMGTHFFLVMVIVMVSVRMVMVVVMIKVSAAMMIVFILPICGFCPRAL